jgi:5-methylthioribose kinase
MILLTESTVAEYVTDLINSKQVPSLVNLFSQSPSTADSTKEATQFDEAGLLTAGSVSPTEHHIHPMEPCSWKGTVIHGGNINFAFSVVNTVTGMHLFVKQAPNYVALFGPDVLPLSNQRMHYEYKAYQEWNTILGPDVSKEYLPTLYHFDSQHMILILEFLQNYTLLEHVLRRPIEDCIQPQHHPLLSISHSLGRFMGNTHAATHSSILPPDRIEYWIQSFHNTCMRTIQLEYVFTKCFQESTIQMGKDFEKEIEHLKSLYRGEDTTNLALCHGDFHFGSVMIQIHNNHDDEEDDDIIHVKIIDPEFAIYGPPGLDVGCLISGYILAAIFHTFSTLSNDNPHPHPIQVLTQAIQTLWSSYYDTMIKEGISESILKRIEVDTVGFAVAEVCRTALGFAGGRSSWLLFSEDTRIQIKAKATALNIAKQCMQARHFHGIACIVKELNALVSEVDTI